MQGKKQGISRRQFAKRDGCSATLVRRALERGHLIAYDDGSINPGLVGTPWRDGNRSDEPSAPPSPAAPPLEALDTYAGAQRSKENYLAKLRQLEFEVKSGRLVAADGVRNAVFRLARADRDSLMNWPSRVSPELAAELGVDQAAMTIALEKHIRAYLSERSQTAYPRDGAE